MKRKQGCLWQGCGTAGTDVSDSLVLAVNQVLVIVSRDKAHLKFQF